jgi:hypothetical protein
MLKFILIEYSEYWRMKKKKRFWFEGCGENLDFLKQGVDSLFVKQWEQ